jgi:type II secretory pathway component PulF
MWIIIGIVAFIIVGKWQSNTRAGRISLSVFSLHIPILGNFILKSELSRFCRTLEMLIKNGIPILDALETSIPVLENEIIKNKLRTSYKDLEQGGSFGKSLKDADLFPLFMSNLIIVGEESGQLEDALGEVADCYERDTDEMMKVMSSLLEPLMILVMGLIVGFIVISMLLPIFQINLMAG